MAMTTTTTTPTSATAVCAQCRCVSTLPALFQKGGDGLLCPVCAAKQALRKEQLTYGGLLFLIVVNIGGSWLLRGEPGQFGIYLLFILAILLLLVILHELSHATVGWLVGGRVFGIHLGMGRLLFQRWLGNFYVGVSQLPTSGICFVGIPPGRATRLRYGLVVAAGPLFHLLLTLLLLTSPRNALGLPSNRWLFMTILINGFLLLVNLWPWLKVQTNLGAVQSDGSQLWQLLRGRLTSAKLEQSYYQMAASFALQQQQDDRALAEIAAGLARYPDNPLLRQLHGYILIRRDQMTESLAIWHAMLDAPPAPEVPPALHGYLQGLHYNNVAWALLMLNRTPADLTLASDYADRAFAMLPWLTPVRGTLAAAKVARGDDAAGVELALAVAEEHRQLQHPLAQENRAANLATAALGYHHQGNAQEAQRLLGEAQALAPQEIAVRRASTLMQG